MSVLSFAPPPPPALFKCKIVVEIIPYYHTAKLSSFTWIDWSRAFYFKICFGITLVSLDFDEKHTHYLISRVKRLSSVALYGWSSAFQFRIRFKKRKSALKTNILNEKYLSASPAFFWKSTTKALILVKKTLTVFIFRLNHEIYYSKCSFNSI